MSRSVQQCLLFFVVQAISLAVQANDITVLNLGNLSFGKFAVGSGGSVTISPLGTRSKSGGVVLVSGGTESAGIFRLNGPAGQAYILSLPSNNEATLSSGLQSLTISDFTISPSTTGALSLAGDQTLYLGGTLLIDSSKPAGEYSGSFSILVDYQ